MRAVWVSAMCCKKTLNFYEEVSYGTMNSRMEDDQLVERKRRHDMYEITRGSNVKVFQTSTPLEQQWSFIRVYLPSVFESFTKFHTIESGATLAGNM
jgi:hypothetical protein